MSVRYDIISTGSRGNAVVVDSSILIDCGIPFRALNPYLRELKLVLLTHIHSDHFNPVALRRLAHERPTLRFACCRWLAPALAGARVPTRNIDVLEIGRSYRYAICTVVPVMLAHDVPNCGYKLHLPGGRVFYATDTSNLNGIEAKGYDLYLVEANYEDEEIRERIKEKEIAGEYAYEKRVLKNHLSKAKCDDFIYRNIGPDGTYVYLHGHIGKEGHPELYDTTLSTTRPSSC